MNCIKFVNLTWFECAYYYTIIGICFNIKSIGLLEDLPLDAHYPTSEKLYAAVDEAYEQNAFNCWIAACIYMFLLILTGHQLYANSVSYSGRATIMGFFYHWKSVAFSEDLPFNKLKKYTNLTEFYADIDQAYDNNTASCWVAALMYGLVFIFSYVQFCDNRNRV